MFFVNYMNVLYCSRIIIFMELTDIKTGLSTLFVQKHLSKKKGHTNKNISLIFSVLYSQIASIFFILLLVSAILSFIFSSSIDGWIFIIINLANVILGFVQEFRASKASQLLEGMIDHSASVIRDGTLQQIKSENVVVGDILLLGPGDVLVADIVNREVYDAYVDMSVLTGESLPIEARVGEKVLSGCSLSSGRLVGQVIAASDDNSLRKYSEKLDSIKKNNSFVRFISNVSINILLVTLLSILLVGVFGVVIEGKYGVAEFILYAIAMLVGVVPESLPLIITLMLTREALSLAKEKVIVKNLSSLQQLGSIKYLLTDKTGTLTENNIRVSDIVNIKNVELYAQMIAQAEYERTPMDGSFDTAILAKAGETQEKDDTGISGLIAKPDVTPFKSSLGYAVFSFDDVNVIRGQFTSVRNECKGLTIGDIQKYDDIHASYENQGLRVIAFASKKKVTKGRDTTSSVEGAGEYVFEGLYVFEDPLKPDASHSYHAALGMGISVKVLTGDSPRVALYVGKELDRSIEPNQVCSLDEVDINKLTEEDFNQDTIYARCHPDHKLALIDMHEKHGPVGFLGEGINDALALKRADVGMVVYNASDVARQSADVLLMEKSLNPIIHAIQMSRKVYAHIYTYLLCTLAGNLGTLFSLTAVALLWTDIPMLPVQILLNNLLTDVPLLLLVTDRLSKIDYTKPIDHSAREFFRQVTIFALISTVFDMIYFFIFKEQDLSVLRTGWFVFSVLCELILVLSLRSSSPVWSAQKISKQLAIGLVVCACVAISLPFIPFFAKTFHLVRLAPSSIAIIVAILSLYLTTNETYKYISRRIFK